jgi:hypothetical protein
MLLLVPLAAVFWLTMSFMDTEEDADNREVAARWMCVSSVVYNNCKRAVAEEEEEENT